VGIGADWDGGGGVDGMKDIADLPQVTDVLLDAGYSQQDVAKIWGGNLMRVLRDVEAKRSSPLTSPKSIN
jgi:membrane dipeptidase